MTTTYISILRGINVSGQKKILMADLKVLYETLKFTDVTTYIQSGNVVFRADKKTAGAELARKIEQAISKKYKFDVPVIVRTADEMKKAMASNPFVKDKKIDVDKLHVTFLSDAPEEINLESIKKIDFSPDQFVIIDKDVFLHCPQSYGEPKLSNKFVESRLKVTATTRNWKTVHTLADMAVKI